MNVEQLLIESLQLLGLGMGSVFIILVLLICIVWIVSKLAPEELPEVQSTPGEDLEMVGHQHVAAIQAAIHKFRKSR